MKTLQDIYNEVAEKMIKQKGPAKNYDTNTCTYINQTGKKCAVGCLFSDEDAAMLEKEWGGESCTPFMDLTIEKLELDPNDKDNIHRLLLDLQGCHDRTEHSTRRHWNDYWYQRMTQIAKHHGLDYSILSQGA